MISNINGIMMGMTSLEGTYTYGSYISTPIGTESPITHLM